MHFGPPSKNDIIHVRCLIKKSPIILKDLKPDYIKITYKVDGKMRDIRIFGELKSNIKHIYLCGFNRITNLSNIFSCCEEVNYISFNSFQRYNNIIDISFLFYNCIH